jgi:hypothetical protein
MAHPTRWILRVCHVSVFARSPDETDFASGLYPRVARHKLKVEVEMAFLPNRPQGLMMPTGLGSGTVGMHRLASFV